jgi:cell division protein FtsB
MDMTSLYVVLLAATLILCYVTGEWNARRNFKDAILFQTDLRKDRDQLRRENEELRTEVNALRQEILELRHQLNVAVEQIALLSSNLHSE